MFVKRLTSGVVLVALAVIVLYLGGWVTWGTMLALSLGGSFELLRVFRMEKSLPAFISYLMTIGYYLMIGFAKTQHMMGLIIVFMMALLSIYVLTYPTFSDKRVFQAFFSFFYVSLMISYIYKIRELPNGGFLILLVFICSWLNDTAAYCVGVTMGKHKMSPKLSPKKSIEGLVGGIVFSAIFGAIYGAFFSRKVCFVEHCMIFFGIIGGVGAAIAVIGDLTASGIKRNHKIKDYGKLIPGHGGILDRFDSIIFTAPIVYFLLVLLLDL